MKTTKQKVLTLLTPIAAGLFLAACAESDSDVENAAEEIGEAVEEVTEET